jgi:aspartyl-tRNA(Asn)/glutamyl-tRNA(Gln) amidotransferase subunit A
LPAISIPAGLARDGLPLGLQLIGRAFDESSVLRAAGVLETLAHFTEQPDLASRLAETRA